MYSPAANRYGSPQFYRRCGRSGVKLPLISLGLWHNFGAKDSYENARAIACRAFDLGITHFDLANNYGPPDGSAEETFGKILRDDLGKWRDEMIITTKAGYYMWPGPYGEWGSRKNLLASLDQSLKRMGLPYVDIFYHHRPDPETPLEETMGALVHAVRSGKALYIGLSNYPPDETLRAVKILRAFGTRCLIHQPRYSMLDRWVEPQLLTTLELEGIGCAVFSPLAKGVFRPLFQRHPRRFACGTRREISPPGGYHRYGFGENKKAQRPRALARPDARANGAGVGVAQPDRNERAHRREQSSAGGRLRGRREESEFHRRRIGAD
jgi:L-glyceraldehyde 3-phosphate reductase